MKTATAFLLTFTILPVFSFAQTGNFTMLDTSFGKHGKVVTRKVAKGPNTESSITSIVLQNDGKIIAGGEIYNRVETTEDFTLVRYNPDGEIDFTFGDSGIIYKDYNNSADFLVQIKKQSTEKLIGLGVSVLNGSNKLVYLLFRYNSDGSLDYTFGENGWVILPSSAYAIAIQANDNIIVCGEEENSTADTVTLRRYLYNGKPDTGFGRNGLGTVVVGKTQLIGIPPVVAIDNDERIVVGFTSVVRQSAIDDFVVARFTKNGIIDSSFNDIGLAVIDYLNRQDYLQSIAIQADNKIVVGGGTSYPNDFLIARLKANGKVDKNFGTNGLITTDFTAEGHYPTSDHITTIAIQDDGKIVASGNLLGGNTGLTGRFALARYTADGVPDTGFGFNGQTKTKIESGDTRTHTMLIQPDGKIIAAGYTTSDNDISGAGEFALVRYIKERTATISRYPQRKSITH